MATRLVYGRNGRTVSYIADESWEAADTNPQTAITNYNITALREYRYDSGRARYMARKYNASRVMANMTSPHQWSSNDGEDPPEWRVVEVFTDYEGDEPYGDFVETDSTSVPPTETASYEPGLWRKDLVGNTSEYVHNDGLGSLRQTTSSSGSMGTLRIYTAYGDKMGGPVTSDRYGYVGQYGYQTHDGMPFLHVGARYYDPTSGRFLQRDSIGIEDGSNVYAYVRNQPVTRFDPSGHGFWDWLYTGDWNSPPSVTDAARDEFDRSNNDRFRGTLDAAVCSWTGWISNTGGTTFDDENRRSAEYFANGVITTTGVAIGGAKWIIKPTSKGGKLLWEVMVPRKLSSMHSK